VDYFGLILTVNIYVRLELEYAFIVIFLLVKRYVLKKYFISYPVVLWA